MRVQRVWRIVERFNRFYVENQWGGFAGWHTTREAAVAQGRKYVQEDYDVFHEEPPTD